MNAADVALSKTQPSTTTARTMVCPITGRIIGVWKGDTIECAKNEPARAARR